MKIKIAIIIIMAGLLLGCLLKMPYGYYQLTRWLVSAGFIALIFIEFKKQNFITSILCVVFAVLFNPLKPIYLKKELWQFIDKWLAVVLIIWILVSIGILLLRKKTKAY
jgi:hypothetical protein